MRRRCTSPTVASSWRMTCRRMVRSRTCASSASCAADKGATAPLWIRRAACMWQPAHRPMCSRPRASSWVPLRLRKAHMASPSAAGTRRRCSASCSMADGARPARAIRSSRFRCWPRVTRVARNSASLKTLSPSTLFHAWGNPPAFPSVAKSSALSIERRGAYLRFTLDCQPGIAMKGTGRAAAFAALAIALAGCGSSNKPPTATPATLATNEDQPVAGVLVASDPDGDALTIQVGTAPTRGLITLSGGLGFTYTPNADANGTDSFLLVVTDTKGNSASATIAVTITPVDDPPKIVTAFALDEDTPATVDLVSDPEGLAVTVA